MTTARQERTGQGADLAALLMEQAHERERIAAGLLAYGREIIGDAAFLSDAFAYVLSAPGKLLRPLLFFDACRAAGGESDMIYPAALGTEFGHVASLIHDDIIDDDSERRGQPTLHEQFDLGSAILTGDALIFSTFLSYTRCLERGVSAERVVEAIRRLSATCIEMCRGQALETQLVNNLDASEALYLDVIRMKTARFCQTVSFLGAYLGGANLDDATALGEYGLRLGMAFQIVDDLLCYQDATPLLGKSQTSDLCNRRVTLAIIYALRAGDDETRQTIRDAFATPDEASDTAWADAYTRVTQALHRTRALEKAQTLVRRYTKQARQCLEQLPLTDARTRLMGLVTLLAVRTY